MELIIHVVLSVAFGYSLAILLVEKGEDWPIYPFVFRIKNIINKFSNKASLMLDCTVCTSFWATLIGEVFLYLFITNYFLWPFTGILSLGFTWSFIEIMNIIDKNSDK